MYDGRELARGRHTAETAKRGPQDRGCKSMLCKDPPGRARDSASGVSRAAESRPLRRNALQSTLQGAFSKKYGNYISVVHDNYYAVSTLAAANES